VERGRSSGANEDMTVGLVVGKFWPPHAGHRFLIDQLVERCDRVFVVVCASRSQMPSGRDRAMWIQAEYPFHEVVVVDDLCAWHHPGSCSDECSEVWRDRINELNLEPIDIVATSEPYGERFADLLGVHHMQVDLTRTNVPITASLVRDDLSGSWHFLDLSVRKGLVRRVVVLGAESTGTSTLTRNLAEALSMPSTAEAGRTVSWELYAAVNEMTAVQWSSADFWSIVNHQISLEHRALEFAANLSPGQEGPWIVCDTDTLATVAWWERYLGSDPSALLEFAKSRLADLYLLTDPTGVDFDASDPLRDGAAIRVAMHERFVKLLEEVGVPWFLVTGSPSDRLTTAVEVLTKFETSNPRWVHQ
jgi:HTH-type transcriptional repressor of NAD biosynthesis genes